MFSTASSNLATPTNINPTRKIEYDCQSRCGMKEHWRVTADYTNPHHPMITNPLIGGLAECDNGELWLPAWKNKDLEKYPEGYWNRPLNTKNPLHWPIYLRAKIARKIVMIELY